MRIAVSGAHGTGKSTLIAGLGRHLPSYVVLEEAYYTLLEEGHAFGDTPMAEDFEVQLERSCRLIENERGEDVIFDRCPADYLAYLTALKDGDASSWVSRAREAMDRVDLVIHVPIERPDRIAIDRTEFSRLRRDVDEQLRHLLIDDGWGIEADVISVEGDMDERVSQVVAEVTRRKARLP